MHPPAEDLRTSAAEVHPSRADRIKDWVLSKTVLAGVQSAYLHDEVSSEEYDKTLDFLDTKDAKILTGLQIGFFGTSRAADIVASGFYADAMLNGSSEDIMDIVAIHQLGPTALRGVMTLTAGLATGKDLKKMSLQSMIPFIGSYIAIPKQISREYKDSSDIIRHNNRRLVSSKLSRLMRRGGWGSNAEKSLTSKSYRYQNQIAVLMVEYSPHFSISMPG